MTYRNTVKHFIAHTALLLAGTALLTGPSHALSPLPITEPEVYENTIVLPFGGWYQVQNTTGYSTVCEGFIATCTAEDGDYLVVNHTTQQRWEQIRVGVTPLPISLPTVEGNTIIWAPNGWYQVQNATTYESICEGGTSCTVDDGNYILINHTRGARYELTVGDETPGPIVGDNFSILGNTISFSPDGWFQAQNATTYETACQGFAACTLPDGRYIIINHTTGERFENVVLPAGPAVERTDQCSGDVYVSGTVSRDLIANSYNEPFIPTADAHVRMQLTTYYIDGPSTILAERDVPFSNLPFDFAICADASEVQAARLGELTVSMAIFSRAGVDARVGDLISERAYPVEGPTSGMQILVSGLEHCDAENAGGFCTSNE